MSEYKYKLSENADGSFVISGGENRDSVCLSLNDSKTGIIISNDPLARNSFNPCSFFDVRLACTYVGNLLMRNWKPKNPNKSLYAIIKWAQTKAAMAAAPLVSYAFKTFREKSDPTVVDFQKRLFGIANKIPTFVTEDGTIYKYKYFIQDAMKFRAACYAIWHMNIDFTGSLPKKIKPENWMSAYSPDRKVYRALALTLQNLPGRLHYNMIGLLSYFRLERPITDRLELGILLGAASRIALTTDFSFPRGWRDQYLHIFQHATHKEIKRSIALIEKHRQQKFNLSKIMTFYEIANFITDYPDGHNGNIVGLTEKSIRWHRETRRRNIMSYQGNIPSNQATAKPPIDLPKNEKLKFLSSAGELWEEGTNMGHCVGTYASRAINGDCFIFHAQYENEQATIEVDRYGDVVQSQGPYNKQNKASKWAAAALKKWGKNFSNHPEPKHTGEENYAECPF